LTLLNMPLVMNSPNRHPGNNNTLWKRWQFSK
jgi:hypothetical protein